MLRPIYNCDVFFLGNRKKLNEVNNDRQNFSRNKMEIGINDKVDLPDRALP